MNIWLDTTDIETIKRAAKMGILHGVTTNPTLIAESGKPLEKVLEEILEVQEGPVTAQVTATEPQKIIEQAESLQAFSTRVIPKIPATEAGFKATTALASLHRREKSGLFSVMVTAVFTPLQALAACRVGARYIAPYFHHIEESGHDAHDALIQMLCLISHYEFETELIACSIRDEEVLSTCLEIGVHGVTLKKEVFDDAFEDYEPTLNQLKRFKEATQKGKPSKLLP